MISYSKMFHPNQPQISSRTLKLVASYDHNLRASIIMGSVGAKSGGTPPHYHTVVACIHLERGIEEVTYRDRSIRHGCYLQCALHCQQYSGSGRIGDEPEMPQATTQLPSRSLSLTLNAKEQSPVADSRRAGNLVVERRFRSVAWKPSRADHSPLGPLSRLVED